LGAPGGGLSAQLQPWRCPLHEAISRCSVVGLAIGQPSTEPIRRRREQDSPQTVHPQYVVPHATDFVEVDAHYESPANETEACKPVQVTTQWESARYGTEEEIHRSSTPRPLGGSSRCGVVCFSCLSAASAPLSHRCSDPLAPRRTPRPAPGPLLIFRKIHLYGKTKKSTHGHTNHKTDRVDLCIRTRSRHTA
jgi:hypothetical protein